MQHPPLPLGIYLAHAGFFLAFVVARLVASKAPRDQAGTRVLSSGEATAPASRVLVSLHFAAFGLLYLGIAGAVFGRHPRLLFPPQILAGALLIAAGAVLACWTLLWFRSWRFRATIEVGHELATGGPFGILRHPIYMALNLLALGTALWHPTPLIWAGCIAIAVLSDLRGRSEELLLLRVFGPAYTSYCERTRRFIPAIY